MLLGRKGGGRSASLFQLPPREVAVATTVPPHPGGQALGAPVSHPSSVRPAPRRHAPAHASAATAVAAKPRRLRPLRLLHALNRTLNREHRRARAAAFCAGPPPQNLRGLFGGRTAPPRLRPHGAGAVGRATRCPAAPRPDRVLSSCSTGCEGAHHRLRPATRPRSGALHLGLSPAYLARRNRPKKSDSTGGVRGRRGDHHAAAG